MKRSYAEYFAALLLFGLNGIVASHIELESYQIVFLRTGIGSILLLALFLLSGHHFSFRRYKRDFLFVILSGIAMGIGWLFLYAAYAQVGVSISSLLYYCGPVIVMALSPLLFREKLCLGDVKKRESASSHPSLFVRCSSFSIFQRSFPLTPNEMAFVQLMPPIAGGLFYWRIYKDCDL